MKKASLSTKLIITMMILVTGTVVLCWFFSGTFLEKYYSHHKQEELLRSYRVFFEASYNGTLYEDTFDVEFEKMCNNRNFNIIVVNGNNELIRSSANNVPVMMQQVQEMIYGTYGENELIRSTEEYVLIKQRDPRLNAEYLMFWGNLFDGGYVYFKTPMESIRESAKITNQFFLIVSLVSLLASLFVIVFSSRRIAKPLRTLSGLSSRMAVLDFDAKYTGDKSGTSEIEELGIHMNEMSVRLEKTISELKTANLKLQQDIAQKEEIDEMRKEFLSNVSHELKTPLALISGYAEGLKDGVFEENQEEYCEIILDEAQKMTRMVQKLLTLNQLEFGNETVEMQRFDMTELAKGVLNANALLAKQAGVTIEFEETKPVYVWADEFRIEEVLTNYVSNAFCHVAGEKRIRVFFEQKDSKLRVSVYNTGEQIPSEDLDRIWEKFYKVDKARTREYGGNGIGLSIVKAIMDSHKQAFGVKNVENGVEFYFELESYML